MPTNISVAAFIFGAILLLIAILGGNFEIFGAKVSVTVGKVGRLIAGMAGIALIIFSLTPDPSFFTSMLSRTTPTPTLISTTATPTIARITPTVLAQTFQCRITKEVGTVNLRAGPGASYQSIKLLQPDNIVSIKGWTDPVGQSGTAWFQAVSTDNQEGWIISRPYPERGLDYACNFDVTASFPFPRVSFPK